MPWNMSLPKEKGSTSAEIKQNLPQTLSRTCAELLETLRSYTRLFSPAGFLSKNFDAKNTSFAII